MLDSPAKLQPRLDEIVASHLHREGPLLPILHDVQAEWGHIPDAAQPVIAHALNISKAELHGVVTFYHDFRDHPAGRHTLRICRAEACQSMGGNATAEAAKKALGIDWHGTTPDGAVTLEPVFCLGLCACAPAAQLDGDLHARVDADKLATLIASVKA
jgi:formate dehydrogenase subunit gamma